MDLFTSLRRFRPSDKRDPLEDYLTEVWRWVLVHDPDVAQGFFTLLGLEDCNVRETRWDTQVRLANGSCVVDLIGDVPNGPVIVCEHKVWAALGDRQIERYRDAASARWSGRRTVTVLVTARTWQHVRPADRALTWPDIYTLVAASHGGQSGVLLEFLAFLQANYLGPTRPVLTEALLAHDVGFDLTETLQRLFGDVARAIAQRPVAARMAPILGTKAVDWPPTFDVSRPEKRWGRLGFELPSQPAWRPGCFIGVLMDPRDHHVSWSKANRGPDLTVILSFHLEPGIPDRGDFLESPEFRGLLERLVTDGPAANVDVQSVRDRNPWHPLHLRRPLVEVLRDASDASTQTEATLSAIDQLLALLLEGGELEALAARLRAGPAEG